MRRLLILLLTAMPIWAVATTVDDAIDPPLWAYPVSEALPAISGLPDADMPQRVPGSNAEITKAQLRNLYQAPDWRPETHDAMPVIVAQGRNPGVFACGYCHLPSGTGRPENANLTGLTVGSSGFTAHVPPGSVAAGSRLAASDARGPSCSSCHGADLRGRGDIPRLAARSPTYLMRQLIDFRNGARAGRLSEPMAGLVRGLSLNDMMALAAYAASLPP